MKSEIEEIIKKIILKETRPIPAGILMEKVLLVKNVPKRDVYQVIDDMIKINALAKNIDGKIIEGYFNTQILEPSYQGIVAINSSLDGYVKLVDELGNFLDQEAYINKINLHGALSGDLVQIKYMADKYTKTKVQHAVVTNIINHHDDYVVGTFELTGNDYHIKLDDPRNYLNIRLDDIDGLINGYKLLIKIDKYDENIAYGHVIKIIGHKNDVGVDILSIVLANKIEPDFTKSSLDQASMMKIDLHDHEGIRRDLQDRLIVTIDPPTSKDLDDAIHVKRLDNGNYFLSVSIADVSNYISLQSPLWNEAMERSTSVYLVDRVIPMLPHHLSNNICSLNPNEPRLCLTCDIEIDSEGNFYNIDVYPSLIRSQYRFSYDEVNQYFANHDYGLDEKIKLMLDDCLSLHKVLRTRKQKDGYIDFEIPEPKIIVDENCWPIAIDLRQRGIAQKMIEDFMVAANEAVTIKASELEIPFIYRVHKKPDIKKLENFAIEAKKLGFKTNHSDFENITPKTISKWLEINHDNPNINLLSKLLLRCMQKAEYSIHNFGHFGLSSEYYTHFTSPIRRSADTIVHKLFWMFYFCPDKFDQSQKDYLKNNLDAYCQEATKKEIIAINTEREVNQLKFCQYMSKHINDVFVGTISTIKSFGIFIELENTIEVLVRINQIGKDFWTYNEHDHTIVGSKTKKVFSFGQQVKVKIANVSIENKQINAHIIGFEPILNDTRRDHYRKIPPHKRND